MKLLFDQNLSPKLVDRLADLFPGSVHVQSVGLECAEDDQIWEYSRLNELAIVSKDEDYNHLCCEARRPKSSGTNRKLHHGPSGSCLSNSLRRH